MFAAYGIDAGRKCGSPLAVPDTRTEREARGGCGNAGDR